MGHIPLVTTIQIFDPEHSYFTQKSIGSIKSHCKHVGNIINLGQKLVEFEFGNGPKLNVQLKVWPWPFISDPAMKRCPL